MKTIKVTCGNEKLTGLFLRQTHEGKGIWGDCKFVINEPVDRCDWWIVCHASSLKTTEKTICDPNHIVYISMEPTEQSIPARFLKQFSKLVICDPNVRHKNIHLANGLTWWVGMDVRHDNGHHFSASYALDYDKLKSMTCPAKVNRISVICSRNQSLPGHHKRLAFLDKLQQHPISEYIDFFGGGHRPIPDKWDAIAPYKYHLVLENSVVPDYWSEKLGDAYLGFSYPIYYGCPNIADYFSTDSLKVIDIDNFEQSVAVLEDLISFDHYDQHADAIVQARDQVLNKYNIFQLMANICNEPAHTYDKCQLKPVGHFVRSWPRRMARKVIYRLRGI